MTEMACYMEITGGIHLSLESKWKVYLIHSKEKLNPEFQMSMTQVLSLTKGAPWFEPLFYSVFFVLICGSYKIISKAAYICVCTTSLPVCMCLPKCMYVYYIQQEALESLELGLRMVVTCMWVLRLNPGPL